jgi:hypothetical protein
MMTRVLSVGFQPLLSNMGLKGEDLRHLLLDRLGYQGRGSRLHTGLR